MSGITSPRPGATPPPRAPRRRGPALGLVRNLLELLVLGTLVAYPAGAVAHAAAELARLGWHAWPW